MQFLNEDNLYPDENYTSVKNEKGQITTEDMVEGKKRLKEYKDHWKKCLHENHLLAHEGAIATKFIYEHEEHSITKNMWYCLIQDTNTVEELDWKLDVAVQSSGIMKWRYSADKIHTLSFDVKQGRKFNTVKYDGQSINITGVPAYFNWPLNTDIR